MIQQLNAIWAIAQQPETMVYYNDVKFRKVSWISVSKNLQIIILYFNTT